MSQVSIYQKQVILLEDRLTLAISILRSIHNATRSIYQAPYEILTQIFRYLVENEELHPSNHYDTVLALSRVCRSWRRVTLGFPWIWSHVAFGSARHGHFAKIFMERSNPLQLNVQIYQLSKAGVRHLRQVDRNLSQRVSRLTIDLLPGGGRYHPFSALSYPAPNLQSLAYIGKSSQETYLDLPGLFVGPAPQLRQLSLVQYNIWPTQIMRNLTSLRLQILQQKTSRSISDRAMVEVLQENPRLEELVLINAGPDYLRGRGVTLPQVFLPQLRILGICDGHPATIYCILSILVAPNLLITVFSDCYLHGAPMLFNGPPIPAFLHELFTDFISHYTFTSSYIWNDKMGKVIRVTFSGPTSAFVLQFHRPNLRTDTFRALLDSPSLRQISELHFDLTSAYSRKHMYEFGHWSSTLRDVVLVSVTLDEDVWTLQKLMSKYYDIFPGSLLHNLAVQFPFNSVSPQAKWWSMLNTFINSRATLGRPVTHLTLKSIYGFVEDMSSLPNDLNVTLMEDGSAFEMEMPEGCNEINDSWSDYRAVATFNEVCRSPFLDLLHY